MTRVLVAGTFDLLHPGHVYYMERARAYGDELWAIIARATNVTHKGAPALPAVQRREMVEALAVVDRAVLGSERSIFDRLPEIEPDVIALGYDQYHETSTLQAELNRRGFETAVVRIGPKPNDEDLCYSSSAIAKRVCSRRAKFDQERDDQSGNLIDPANPSPHGLDIPSPSLI